MAQEPASGAKDSLGPSTRAVHSGPRGSQGEPFLPPVTLAAPYHLQGDPASTPYGYARYANPTWSALEEALGELEGGPALVFASGMAAAAAVLATLPPGSRLVLQDGGYYGLRLVAAEAPIEVIAVPPATDALVAACEGADLVWVETPANPLLEVVDIAAVAGAAREAGARLAADNTLATPLGQQPLALGADFSVTAATKALAGHSDVLLGVVAARDGELLDGVRAHRSRHGAIAGPFEAWLTHRSLATLDLRLGRASDSALAVARALREHGVPVWHPADHEVAHRQMARFGPLVSFDLGTEERANAFFARARLVYEATSFGGVHSTAERRARWGADAVGPGLIRLSAGIEDTADLVADVLRAAT